MNKQLSTNPRSQLSALKPYVLVFACLLIGGASVSCLLLTVLATVTTPQLAVFPFGGFILTLRMAYSIVHLLIEQQNASQPRKILTPKSKL